MMNEHAEVLIIGAGPAGLHAALAAAPSGARIVLLDDNPAPGGQIWRDGPHAALPTQVIRLRERLQGYGNVQVHTATRVIARPAPYRLLVENEERGWIIDYAKLILCTGARELLLPFPGWTLPGVTGAGGLQALVKGGLPIAGERVVVAGSGPLLLASAHTAQKQGARVIRIAEQASPGAVARFAAQLPRWPHKALQALQLGSAVYRTDSYVLAALGSERLEGVRLMQRGRIVEIPCERLACGFGLVPNTQLGEALGCALQAGTIAVDGWQASSLADHFAAGECTGFGGSELASVEGSIAGHAAVGDQATAARLWSKRSHWQGFAAVLNRAFTLRPALSTLCEPDTLVCRCEDVPYAAVQPHGSWREAKLATRCGMGACQGRVCGAATAQLFGWQPSTPRPPFSPARIATLLCIDDHPPT